MAVSTQRDVTGPDKPIDEYGDGDIEGLDQNGDRGITCAMGRACVLRINERRQAAPPFVLMVP